MKIIVCGLFFVLCCTVLARAEDISAFSYISTDKKYGLSLYKLSWIEAQHYCAAQGYTLANIPTYTEQKALVAFIQTIDEISSLSQEPIWTSGTNQGQSNANQYVWLSSGARVSYSNYQTNTSGANRCIAINGLTGRWTREDCRTARYFVCEIKCPAAETDTENGGGK